uniref:Extradiol ring-cleavage dioxygenase class III enzyme subunit B domain-containing protein n=1 Tax=Angomonas deanei TaxID=59799 RepID=C6K3Q1_9TRYP|nr:conserved hypothetical protein [Angomonas deanei]
MSHAQVYPALFICHGAGPLPVLGAEGHVHMVDAWKAHVSSILKRYGNPRAIAVVSAHYQTAEAAVGGGAQPGMIYDYYNFPPAAYELRYPAPGDAALSARMVAALQKAGFSTAAADPERGFDHGVFVPLLATFPDASIPVIPISVLASDDPAEHIRFGQALRPFREEGVLFIGSGSSFHHSQYYQVVDAGSRFGDALTTVLGDETLSKQQRLEKLAEVGAFDGFEEAQPPGRHEHLMPLLTLAGTANGAAAREAASIPFGLANAREYIFEE